MAGTAQEIEFDSRTHTYRVNGEVYPSVMQVLKEAGAIDARWFTEETRYRGAMVALLTELDDKGRLPEQEPGTRFTEYWPYLESWRQFRAEVGFVVDLTEERVWSLQYKYAGTLDRLGTVGQSQFLLDIKTGSSCPWHRLQTIAYKDALAESHFIPCRSCNRGTVILQPDRYKFREHTEDVEDRSAWLSLLNWYNWKKRNG